MWLARKKNQPHRYSNNQCTIEVSLGYEKIVWSTNKAQNRILIHIKKTLVCE